MRPPPPARRDILHSQHTAPCLAALGQARRRGAQTWSFPLSAVKLQPSTSASVSEGQGQWHNSCCLRGRCVRMVKSDTTCKATPSSCNTALAYPCVAPRLPPLLAISDACDGYCVVAECNTATGVQFMPSSVKSLSRSSAWTQVKWALRNRTRKWESLATARSKPQASAQETAVIDGCTSAAPNFPTTKETHILGSCARA